LESNAKEECARKHVRGSKGKLGPASTRKKEFYATDRSAIILKNMQKKEANPRASSMHSINNQKPNGCRIFISLTYLRFNVIIADRLKYILKRSVHYDRDL